MIRPLVTIEESTILGMLGNQQLLNAFPFLQQLKNTLSDIGACGTCRRDKKNQEKLRRRREAMSSARVTFATLPGSSRTTLKQILQARKVRVTYFSGKKKIVVTY